MTVFKGQKILIVEDNFISYKLIDAYLRKSNLELLHASDGLKAIEMFKETPDLSLILMDIQLPGLNGLDTTRKIREMDKDIPIVAATANVFDDDRLACEEAGCTNYISKPIDFKLLFELLEKYLG